MFISIPLKDTIKVEYLDRILTALVKNGLGTVSSFSKNVYYFKTFSTFSVVLAIYWGLHQIAYAFHQRWLWHICAKSFHERVTKLVSSLKLLFKIIFNLFGWSIWAHFWKKNQIQAILIQLVRNNKLNYWIIMHRFMFRNKFFMAHSRICILLCFINFCVTFDAIDESTTTWLSKFDSRCFIHDFTIFAFN